MVFLGMVIFIGLFIFARISNLSLTYAVLQYFMSISVILFVLVFQNEIRKYFELIGVIGTRQIKVGKFAPKSPEIVDLVSACVELAKNKWGALIVIKGWDAIDDLVEGGVSVDGIISEEVLLSIFYPNTAGHDGALIISNNRIYKFGSHLPLSINFKEIGKHGTRHSAGLGISEKSDALAIIISEEKGTISLARRGKLKKLTDGTQLGIELNNFIKDKFNSHSDPFFSHIIKHNFTLKVAATVFSVVLWLIYKY